MQIKLEQFYPRRDILFEEVWTQFMNALSSNQRYVWKSRKKHMEQLFRQAWDNGATTILDLLNEALENRSRLVVAQTIPAPIYKGGQGGIKR